MKIPVTDIPGISKSGDLECSPRICVSNELTSNLGAILLRFVSQISKSNTVSARHSCLLPDSDGYAVCATSGFFGHV